MAYIYCDACGIGFHSNVLSCPECGRPVRLAHEPASGPRRQHGRGHGRQAIREDVEGEVRESIYGWRSGTVARCGSEARAKRCSSEARAKSTV